MKLVFYSATIIMMHGPLNIRFTKFFLGTGHPVVFKVKYLNAIKYVLRLAELSFYFIFSNVGN